MRFDARRGRRDLRETLIILNDHDLSRSLTTVTEFPSRWNWRWKKIQTGY